MPRRVVYEPLLGEVGDQPVPVAASLGDPGICPAELHLLELHTGLRSLVFVVLSGSTPTRHTVLGGMPATSVWRLISDHVFERIGRYGGTRGSS